MDAVVILDLMVHCATTSPFLGLMLLDTFARIRTASVPVLGRQGTLWPPVLRVRERVVRPGHAAVRVVRGAVQ
jgi:hypothetical protein